MRAPRNEHDIVTALRKPRTKVTADAASPDHRNPQLTSVVRKTLVVALLFSTRREGPPQAGASCTTRAKYRASEASETLHGIGQ